MMEWILRRPWIWIVLLFVGLIMSWSQLFVLAGKNQPQPIPLESGSARHE